MYSLYGHGLIFFDSFLWISRIEEETLMRHNNHVKEYVFDNHSLLFINITKLLSGAIKVYKDKTLEKIFRNLLWDLTNLLFYRPKRS